MRLRSRPHNGSLRAEFVLTASWIGEKYSLNPTLGKASSGRPAFRRHRRDDVTQRRNPTDLILASQEILSRVSSGNRQANPRFIYEVAALFTSSMVFSFPCLV
jgi:hypothetical protein